MTEQKALRGEATQKTIRPACFKSFEEWEIPIPSEVRELINITGLTSSGIANLVGIGNHRTVRRWIGGELSIPYSVWAILCYHAGFGLIWEN